MRKFEAIVTIVLIVIVLVAALFWEHRSVNAPVMPIVKGLTLSDIQNTSYEGTELINGSSTQDFFHYDLSSYALGDLNRDGLQDAAVVVTVTGADSSDFLYVVMDLNGIASSTPVSIPMRQGESYARNIKVDSISNGIITLDLDIASPTDPHCCPSIQATREYAFVGNTLREVIQ